MQGPAVNLPGPLGPLALPMTMPLCLSVRAGTRLVGALQMLLTGPPSCAHLPAAS